MTKSVFFPLALQYDPDEQESLQKSFGVSERELLSLMREIGKSTKESEESTYGQELIMNMIREEKISPNMVLYLACYGSCKLWETMADGIFLALDAEAEAKAELEG